MNLHQDLTERLSTNETACYFVWETDPMYTREQTALAQKLEAQG